MKIPTDLHVGLLATVVAVAATATVAPAGAGRGASSSPALRVVAANLDNPRKLVVDSKGTVYVAEAGAGGRDRCFTESGSKTCVGLTGAVVAIAGSSQTKVVTGLPSAASSDGSDAEGPASLVVRGNRYVVLIGDGRVGKTSRLGPDGALTGDLVSTRPGKVEAQVLANFGAFEASHNPDHGAGPGTAAGDPALDSNPYDVISFRGGYAVVDAAANDLLWVSPAGKITVLAVFPTQVEHVAAGVVGKRAASLTVQSVPTSVTVGPDGALYVGELTGYPFAVGKARIWRVVPGHKPEVYASGFTNVSDLAFDGNDLLVLEIASRGLRDAGSPGALIRLRPDGTRTVVATAGLVDPTGVAVGDGRIYISDYGTSPATGAGHHGEIVSIPA